MSVSEQSPGLLELTGMTHAVILSHVDEQSVRDRDRQIVFLDATKSTGTALLDFEDIVAIRDFCQDIIDSRDGEGDL